MLWLLEVSFPHPVANHRQDRAVAGDPDNTCRHFINKYGEGCYRLPMKRLIRLAAYAVLLAGEENRHGVGGLEIVLIPKGSAPCWLVQEDYEVLKRFSEKLTKTIARSFQRDFDY